MIWFVLGDAGLVHHARKARLFEDGEDIEGDELDSLDFFFVKLVLLFGIRRKVDDAVVAGAVCFDEGGGLKAFGGFEERPGPVLRTLVGGAHEACLDEPYVYGLGDVAYGGGDVLGRFFGA